ncbi:MAG: response regulator [Deltaproteobacteria bacterium]|nr:response regulator [Deltaproteobacteria bacterium]
MNDRAPFRILIVDDEPAIRTLIRRALEMAGYRSVHEADCVDTARRLLSEEGPFDLVLCDIRMPGDSGMLLLRELAPRAPDTVVVMATVVEEVRVAVESLQSGAYDYVLKPFEVSTIQLVAGRALRRRQLEIENRNFQAHLEEMVRLRTQELDVRTKALSITRHGLLRGLCCLAEFRDPETGVHLDRMAVNCLALARQIQRDSAYAPMITDTFVDQLFESAPLHDIGKVGIPDSILLKPDKLTSEEFKVMKQHTTIGFNALKSIKSEMGEVEGSFIDMAIEVAQSHHERWDGRGYPQGLSGGGIPLSARIVALADMYDACCSPRVYRPQPIRREKVLQMIEEDSGHAFDPVVVEAFFRSKDDFWETEGHLQD